MFPSSVLLSMGLIFGAGSFAAATPTICARVFTDTEVSAEPASIGVSWRYYFDKLRELPHLDRSAPAAVSLRALILSTSKEVVPLEVRLGVLREIHPIDRPVSSGKTSDRISDLQKMPAASQADGRLSHEVLSAYLPSKNPIRVVYFREQDAYIVFDGNGRLMALRAVFDPSVRVTVEHYVSDSALLQLNLRRLLRIRGLDSEFHVDSKTSGPSDQP